MTTQHTPGPWHVSKETEKSIFDSKGYKIATTTYNVDSQLIAAAPDLLACLIEAVRSLEFAAPIIEAPENSAYRETIADARAAIAKATGGAE